MKQTIAVEHSLDSVKDYLKEKGYQVDSVSISREYSHQMDKYDAVVVTGMNDNILGVNDTNTKAIVIEARGLSAEQVYKELQQRLI